jgi:hypothetical protein
MQGVDRLVLQTDAEIQLTAGHCEKRVLPVKSCTVRRPRKKRNKRKSASASAKLFMQLSVAPMMDWTKRSQKAKRTEFPTLFSSIEP